MHIRRKNSGFTLLELAVVLAIIGVVTAGGLVILTASTQSQQINLTVARMERLEKALLDYTIAYRRLPCPSSLTLKSTEQYYGVEAASNGNTCYGGSPSATSKASNSTVEGGIPTRTLQLPDEFMYDGWGKRFRYAVDPSKTATDALPVGTGQCTSTITVNDATGAARTTNAVYALVSHGADGHGGYNANGVPYNGGSTNADELTNCHCDAAATAGTYSATYIQKLASKNPANELDSFDDLVSYKEGWQLQTPNFALSSTACNSSIDVAAACDWDWTNPSPHIVFLTISGTTVTTSVSSINFLNCNPAYSPDGSLLLLAQAYNPVQVYSVGTDGTTLSASAVASFPATPTDSPPASQNDAMNPVFSPDGGYAVGPSDQPGMGAWVYQYSGGAFSHVADITPPTYITLSVAVDNNANHIALGMRGDGNTSATPILIYKRSGSSFSLLSEPSVNFTHPSYPWAWAYVAFSPTGDYLYAVDEADEENKSFRIYSVSGDSFSYISGQPDVQPSSPQIIAVDPSNTYIAISVGWGAGSSFPYIYIYKRSGNTFTQLSSIPQPNGSVSDLKFTKSGNYLVVVEQAAPYMQVYKINAATDTFTMLSDPYPAITTTGLTYLATTR